MSVGGPGNGHPPRGHRWAAQYGNCRYAHLIPGGTSPLPATSSSNLLGDSRVAPKIRSADSGSANRRILPPQQLLAVLAFPDQLISGFVQLLGDHGALEGSGSRTLSDSCRGGCWRAIASGSVKVNTLPWPGSLSTQIRPPCSSTNFFDSVRPRPVPSSPREALVCRNSSKMRAWSCGSMPIPVLRISLESDHPFRSNPITHFGAIRSAVSEFS